MRIRKLCIELLLLAIAVFGSTALFAETTHISYEGGIGIYNPCNSSLVIVNGPTNIEYHENSRGQGAAHVAIHVRFEGTGEDAGHNPYSAFLEAHGQFDSAVSSYDLPFRSMWIGQSTSPNFLMTGTIRVFVNNGSPVGAGIVQVATACKNSDKSDDKDSDGKDKDKDKDNDSGDRHDKDKGHKPEGRR